VDSDDEEKRISRGITNGIDKGGKLFSDDSSLKSIVFGVAQESCHPSKLLLQRRSMAS